MSAKSPLLGTHGQFPLNEDLRCRARLLAAQDYAQAVEDEFCGDEVRDIILPAWIGDVEALLPLSQLRGLNLMLNSSRSVHMYATCGVEPHIDEMDGLAISLVLHSDGFTFRQGRTRLKLAAGDWFLFDDAALHWVDETDESTSLLIVTAALQAVG